MIHHIDEEARRTLQAHYRTWLVRDVLERFENEFQELEMGQITSKILKLPLTVRDLYHQIRIYALPCILVTVIALGYFFYVDYSIGLVSSITLVAFYSFTVLFARRCLSLSRQREVAHNRLHETIDDSLGNLLSVYTSSSVRRELSHLRDHEERFRRQYTRYNRCAVRSKVKFSVMYILAFVVINGFTIYRACTGRITVGTLVSVLLINTYLISDVQIISGELYDFMYNVGVLMESQRFINALLARRSTVAGAGTDAGAGAVSRPLGRTGVRGLRGTVEFRDVVFRYPHSAQRSLDGVSFFIPDGQHVMLRGNIGSGK